MVEDFQTLLDRYNRFPDSRVFAPLADAYRKKGDTAKAIEILEQGLERFPKYASARVILGKCFYDLGATERAKAEFEKVLELDSENMVALKYLGDILLAEERRSEALQYYRRLLSVDPTNKEVEKAVEEIQQSSASREIDLTKPETARDERPKELATLTLAGIYAAQGYYNKALSIYREILSREPMNREAKEMTEKLQAMLDAGEKERGRIFEEPALTISLDDVGDDIAASTAGRGGFGEESKAEEVEEKQGEQPEETKKDMRSESDRDRLASDMENFRNWLRKAKGK